MASQDAWLDALSEAWDRSGIDVVSCPNCGATELRLRYQLHAPFTRERALVVLWCDHCLEGPRPNVGPMPAWGTQAPYPDPSIPNFRIASDDA